jgi:hypothetical protein
MCSGFTGSNGSNSDDDKPGIIKIKSLNKETDPSRETIKFKNIEIVPLETTKDCLIQSLQRSRVIKDSLIFVSDLRNLFVFNRQGKFLNQIGSRGEGPQEYVAFYSYYIDEINNRVVIIDEYRNVYLSYEFNGKFISKKNFPDNTIVMSSDIEQVSENMLLICYGLNYKHDDAYHLLNTKNMKVLAKKSNKPIFVEDLLQHFSGHPISKAEDGFDFMMVLCDTIFNCYNNKFRPKYIIEHSQKMAPKERYKLNQDRPDKKGVYLQTAHAESDKSGYFTGFDNIYETDYHIILTYTLKGFFVNYFIANKNLHQGKYHASEKEATLKETFKKKEFPLFNIRSTDGKNFIGEMSPELLLPYNDHLKDTKDPDLKKLKSVLDNALDDDNPILIFYELKDDFVP